MRFQEEYELFEKTQQEAVERLSKTDMNIDKAAEGLDLKNGSVRDLLLGSFLYGGVRREPAGPEDRASMSPVASPNFEGAKKLLESAFEQGFTMAAVQIGSFYVQEDKLANGKNLKAGEDAKKLAFEWYSKAAATGNPVSPSRKSGKNTRLTMSYIRWPATKLDTFWKTSMGVQRISRQPSSRIKKRMIRVGKQTTTERNQVC